MNIIQIDDGKKGEFQAIEGKQIEGQLFYVWSGPGKFIIEHTEVEGTFQGKGIGKELVEKGVEFARENKLKILPLCPFAKKLFDETPDYADVLF
jgi:hypothetical protein